MKNLNFSKRLSLIASGIALALGMASAQAAPAFQIDPSALGLGGRPVRDIRTISHPKSARIIAANGTGPIASNSTTRTPASGPPVTS